MNGSNDFISSFVDSRDLSISSYMFVRDDKNRCFPCGMRISQKNTLYSCLEALARNETT